MTLTEQLRDLLERLERAEVSEAELAEAVGRLSGRDGQERAARTAETPSARVDLDRSRRCGFPEVVFSEGKTVQGVVEIFGTLAAAGQDCLATRVSEAQGEALSEAFGESIWNREGRCVRWNRDGGPDLAGRVLVITAGTSDRPVSEEAVETLRWMRCGVETLEDVGVAGPHRLLDQRELLEGTDAIVVVAGMEGALPSVVGGWVACPVIAVPTSIGYGAGFGGLAALLGMLNSCAANVTVVNIDAGFKGGYVAGLIALRAAGVASAAVESEVAADD